MLRKKTSRRGAVPDLLRWRHCMLLQSVRKRRDSGFTLVELLVVIAVIAIVARLLLPSLAHAKTRARTADCLNRKHQLALAWLMYAQENEDYLVLNDFGWSLADLTLPPPRNYSGMWIDNWMGWKLDWRITNTVLATRSDLAPLTQYMANSLSAYKCPADTYLSSVQRSAGWVERPRSVAMNQFMGDGNPAVPGGKIAGLYVLYKKLGDMRDKPLSHLWVVMDEHPDSISTPLFSLGYDPQLFIWPSLPASSHGGAATMFFADGHAEAKKWLSPETKPPVHYVYLSGIAPKDKDRRDFDWIWDHATEFRPQ
jgi:prepilin-type N-terminal cleavage/methylation domain-containing protein/prepilin-type processing-associated H-X9-DG protein